MMNFFRLVTLLLLFQINAIAQFNPPFFNDIWPGRPLPTDESPIKGMSKFIHDSIQSAAFDGKGIGYCAVLPKDYFNPAFADSTFPIIYFLHGSTGKETADIYNTKFYYNKMLADSFPQVIMVYPNGMDGYNKKDGYNALAETHIIKELIPFIDKKYRIKENSCAIVGFSLGASAALNFYLKYPELFSHVVCFDGRAITRKNYAEKGSSNIKEMKIGRNEDSFYLLFDNACEKYPGIEKKLKIMILQGAIRNGPKNAFVDYLISKNAKPIFLPADLLHDSQVFYRTFNTVIMNFEAENIQNSSIPVK